MARVSEIAARLDEAVPSSLKLEYDNVGLLCGYPEREVERVLVALDVTLDVIREAEELGAQLLVVHHPVIFQPLKTILDTDAVGARVIALLCGGISAICLHTNLDIVEGGVNDMLAAALGATVTDTLPCGRVAQLAESASMPDFLKTVEQALHVSGLRYYDAGRPVRRIALCGGSGGELVYDAPSYGCDTVLTGEVRYHHWLDGKELGVNVIDADHFCTENVVVPRLAELVSADFPALDVRLSRTHAQTARGF